MAELNVCKLKIRQTSKVTQQAFLSHHSASLYMMCVVCAAKAESDSWTCITRRTRLNSHPIMALTYLPLNKANVQLRTVQLLRTPVCNQPTILSICCTHTAYLLLPNVHQWQPKISHTWPVSPSSRHAADLQHHFHLTHTR